MSLEMNKEGNQEHIGLDDLKKEMNILMQSLNQQNESKDNKKQLIIENIIKNLNQLRQEVDNIKTQKNKQEIHETLKLLKKEVNDENDLEKVNKTIKVQLSGLHKSLVTESSAKEYQIKADQGRSQSNEIVSNTIKKDVKVFYENIPGINKIFNFLSRKALE